MAVYRKGLKWMASVGAGADRVRKTLPDEPAALAWEKAQEAQRAASKALLAPAPAKPKCWTLKQAYDHAYRESWKGTKGEKTARLNAGQALAFFGEDCPVSEITSERVIEYMIELQDEHENSGATCNKKLSALRVMLVPATELGGLAGLPRMKRFKESEHRIRWYTDEDEKLMLKVSAHLGMTELHDFIVLGLDTGFRRNEMLSLTTRDYQNGFLMLHAGETKNGAARSVPCTARVKAIVQARKDAGTLKLFPSLSLNVLRKQWQDLREVLKRNDDPGFIIHVLRHTCATRLVSGHLTGKPVPLNVVQQWMGHKVIATTMRYAHVLPGGLLAAVETLEQVMIAAPASVA